MKKVRVDRLGQGVLLWLPLVYSWIGTAAQYIKGDLSDRVVVFGFQLVSKNNTRLLVVVEANDVYKMKRVIASGQATGSG